MTPKFSRKKVADVKEKLQIFMSSELDLKFIQRREIFETKKKVLITDYADYVLKQKQPPEVLCKKRCS